mgnify:FL=1
MDSQEKLEQKIRGMNLKRGTPIEFVSWDYMGEPGKKHYSTRIGYYMEIKYEPNTSHHDWESIEAHEARCKRNGEMTGMLVFTVCKEAALGRTGDGREFVAFDCETEGLTVIRKLLYR